MRFVAAPYWDLAGRFVDRPEGTEPRAQLPVLRRPPSPLDGRRVARPGLQRGRPSRQGRQGRGRARLDEDGGGRGLAARLDDSEFTVRSVEEKPWRRTPHPPFTHSTLQQEAGRKLRFSAHRTHAGGPGPVRGGYITYMRTDSTTLSQRRSTPPGARRARSTETTTFRRSPAATTSKVKNAQEAHEAIRPAGDPFRTPEQVARDGVSRDEQRLYDLGVEAHRRVADDGRDRRVRLGPRGRDVLGRRARRVRRVRERHQVLRLPQGLRRRRGRPEHRPRRP